LPGAWANVVPNIVALIRLLGLIRHNVEAVSPNFDSAEKGKILLKMVEIKARGAAIAEFTNRSIVLAPKSRRRPIRLLKWCLFLVWSDPNEANIFQSSSTQAGSKSL
jgi:hypothetical protein